MLAKAPKGTKDIMPDQIYKWQYVEKKFKEQAERYGFKEIRPPMFEHTELFKRDVGCPKCREEYKKALQDYYRPYFDALCDTCKDRFYRNPMRLIDCKSPEDHAFAVNAPSILDYLCEDCRNAFEDLADAIG